MRVGKWERDGERLGERERVDQDASTHTRADRKALPELKRMNCFLVRNEMFGFNFAMHNKLGAGVLPFLYVLLFLPLHVIFFGFNRECTYTLLYIVLLL